MCLGHFEPWCSLPLREIFNACIDIFLDVPMPERSIAITHVHHRVFAELLPHGGAVLAKPKFVHRESIRRLNKILDRYNGVVDRYNKIIDHCNGIVYRYDEIVDHYNEMLDRYNEILD